MELEKYTERSKGFIQAAQNLALRSGHQRLNPEHLLKVLLDDKEGLCANLITAGFPCLAPMRPSDVSCLRAPLCRPNTSVCAPDAGAAFDRSWSPSP